MSGAARADRQARAVTERLVAAKCHDAQDKRAKCKWCNTKDHEGERAGGRRKERKPLPALQGAPHKVVDRPLRTPCEEEDDAGTCCGLMGYGEAVSTKAKTKHDEGGAGSSRIMRSETRMKRRREGEEDVRGITNVTHHEKDQKHVRSRRRGARSRTA